MFIENQKFGERVRERRLGSRQRRQTANAKIRNFCSARGSRAKYDYTPGRFERRRGPTKPCTLEERA